MVVYLIAALGVSALVGAGSAQYPGIAWEQGTLFGVLTFFILLVVGMLRIPPPEDPER